jgi:hypothetical protein
MVRPRAEVEDRRIPDLPFVQEVGEVNIARTNRDVEVPTGAVVIHLVHGVFSHAFVI